MKTRIIISIVIFINTMIVGIVGYHYGYSKGVESVTMINADGRIKPGIWPVREVEKEEL